MKGKVYLKTEVEAGFYIVDIVKLENAYNKPCEFWEDNGFSIDDHMKHTKGSKTLSVQTGKGGFHRLTMKSVAMEKLFDKIEIGDTIYFNDKTISIKEI